MSNNCVTNVSNPYDMRLSVEASTEMPLLLTDLVKVIRLGAVTPVAAGILISRPTVQQVLCRTEQETMFYCLNVSGQRRSAPWRGLYKRSTITLNT